MPESASRKWRLKNLETARARVLFSVRKRMILDGFVPRVGNKWSRVFYDQIINKRLEELDVREDRKTLKKDDFMKIENALIKLRPRLFPKKNLCIKGHPFKGNNLIVQRGLALCRICRAERQRKFKQSRMQTCN